MLKKIILGLVVVGLIGGGIVYWQFNKSHRDIGGEEASIQISSMDLFQSYVEDEAGSNKKYLDKVIQINGVITEISNEGENGSLVVLQSQDDFFGVNGYFDKGVSIEGLEVGNEIKIKGHCTGGDDLGVVIAHCSIVK
jgi:hypothetical protein